MQKVLKIDGFVGRNMPWVILLAVSLGVAFPEFFSPLHQHLTVFLAILTFANSLGGGFRDLAGAFKRPLPIIVAFVVMHLMIPTLVLCFGRLVFPDNPDFVNGLVLQFTLPVGVATLMWVGMSGGHMGLCLSMVLMDTLLAPFSIPLVLQLLLGTAVEMDMLGMMKNLMLMVGIPALLGMSIRELKKGAVAKKLKPALSLPGKMMVFLISAASSSECAEFFRRFDRWMIIVLAVTVSLASAGFFIGHLTSKALKMEFQSGFTLTLMVGFRNLSAGIVLAQRYFPAATLLPVSIVPVFQQLLMSVVIKVLWSTKDARKYLAQQTQNE